MRRPDRAWLLLNPNAGGGVDGDRLAREIETAGIGVDGVLTPSRDGLRRVLNRCSDALVVVAGGDGTFRAVAQAARGLDIDLALLPAGTANNSARAFGVPPDPLEAARALADARPRGLDLGVLEGPWGEQLFLEGSGWGFFADLLARYDPDEGKSVWRAVGSATDAILNREAHPVALEVDGHRVEGPLLMVAAMNSRAIGPRLHFAPEADPFDGRLDVVLVREDDRENLVSYAAALLGDDFDDLRGVYRLEGRRVALAWTGGAVHADDQVLRHEDHAAEGGTVRVTWRLEPAALRLWLPAAATDASGVGAGRGGGEEDERDGMGGGMRDDGAGGRAGAEGGLAGAAAGAGEAGKEAR